MLDVIVVFITTIVSIIRLSHMKLLYLTVFINKKEDFL